MASILIPITVLVGVACLVAGLRLYTRFGILRNAGLDEYFLGASLVSEKGKKDQTSCVVIGLATLDVMEREIGREEEKQKHD